MAWFRLACAVLVAVLVIVVDSAEGKDLKHAAQHFGANDRADADEEAGTGAERIRRAQRRREQSARRNVKGIDNEKY